MPAITWSIAWSSAAPPDVYKRQDVDGNGVNEYIVSFLGFAPADDPEVVVLVAFDSPQNVGSKSYPVTADGQYISGGNMAAPVAGDLLVSILDYMDYGKQYTADELAGDVYKRQGYTLASPVAYNTAQTAVSGVGNLIVIGRWK